MRAHKPLADVLNRTATAPAPMTRPARPASADDWQEKAKRAGWREGGKRASGWEQFNVLVPGDVRRAVKAKALQIDCDLSAVVTDLLRKWLDKTV